ncbi:MAG: tripartite tricarboxylate transporter TctB family protein [Lawsonibacter sp.]
MKFKAQQGDLVLGIFSILAGIVILILTKVQGLQLIKSNKMGPGFFPTVCGIAIMICGVMILVELWQRKRMEAKSGKENEELNQNIFNPEELRNLLLFVVLGTAVLLFTNYIGLLPCLGLCVIAYLKIQGRETWRKSILIGVCMVAFLYLVFVLFLHVPVPTGLFGS